MRDAATTRSLRRGARSARLKMILLTTLTTVLALSPAEVLFYRLGVPVGSQRMQRLLRSRNMWKDTAVFDDLPLLDLRVAALERELGAEAARVIILRAPLVLASDLENTLVGRLNALSELLPGLDAGLLPGLIARAPALLELDLAQSIEPRIRAIEAILPNDGQKISTVVKRAPTLLQLTDLEARITSITECLPGVDMSLLVSRAPSLLAYQPMALQRKLYELDQLFNGDLEADDGKPKKAINVLAMVKREPALLTYNVQNTLASKVAVFEAELPGVDVRKLLGSTPRLLSYDAATVLPRKLASLQALLPGAEIPRLVKNVPQLLEFEVEGSLAPKLQSLRALFHPVAAGAPAVERTAAHRLATSKLLAGRTPRRSPMRNKPSVSRAAAASVSGGGRAASGGKQGMSTIQLLRLAALDQSVVERRLSDLSTLMPEVDTIALICKQPSLLRRDVDGSLQPRLLFLTDVLGDPNMATNVVVTNPRLLMSSWGVLARLPFVLQTVPTGLKSISVSTTLMTPKKDFGIRFPSYTSWLRKQIEHVQEAAQKGEEEEAAPATSKPKAKRKAKPSSSSPTVSKLETLLGDLLDVEVAAGRAITLSTFGEVVGDPYYEE